MSKKAIVILYDADCAFCNKCRSFAEKRQKENVHFDFHDIGDRGAPSIVVDPERLRLEKFPACLYIAKHMRQPWPLIASLLRVFPNKIGNWGYDWVSNYRNFLMRFIR